MDLKQGLQGSDRGAQIHILRPVLGGQILESKVLIHLYNIILELAA